MHALALEASGRALMACPHLKAGPRVSKSPIVRTPISVRRCASSCSTMQPLASVILAL